MSQRLKERRLGAAAVLCVIASALGAAAPGVAYADPVPGPAGPGDELPPSEGEAVDPPADGSAPEVTVPVPSDAYADTDPSALTDFRAALDPHGTWVDDPTYGAVWTPNQTEVGSDFTPYASGGHWAYDNDYTWVSDYEWGWAPFHYGRWAFTADRRWAWIPGRTYAAAWVVWRVGNEEGAYVGWAPMAPAWGWREGVAVALGFAAREAFVFCATTDLFAPSVHARIVAGPQAAAIAVRSRPYVSVSATAAHPLAQGMRHGPAPALLGIDAAHVVRPTAKDVGGRRALIYARPSTAQAVGARPAVTHVVRTRPVFVPAVPYAAPRSAGRPSRRR